MVPAYGVSAFQVNDRERSNIEAALTSREREREREFSYKKI
jgi:hypothetical protein